MEMAKSVLEHKHTDSAQNTIKTNWLMFGNSRHFAQVVNGTYLLPFN